MSDPASDPASAERARWLAWLVDIGYGFDWHVTPHPPCALDELAAAWRATAIVDDPDVPLEAWADTLREEVGEWP